MMTVLTTIVASASLTLGLIHAGVWLRDRPAWASLGAAILSVGVAWFAWVSLAMARASTPAAFLDALRWAQPSTFLIVLGIVVFIRFDFRTARPWLGNLACIVRAVTVVVALFRPGGVNYASVVAMHPVQWFGDTIFVVEGVMSRLTWLTQSGLWLLLWFVGDASWRLWRSGNRQERRRALVIGISTFTFVLLAAGQGLLILGGVLRWPHTSYLAYLVVLCAMSYELGSEVLRAAGLARDLQASQAALLEGDRRMAMVADAARLGMWVWDLRTGEIWLSEKCRSLFDLPGTLAVRYEAVMQRLHPEDRRQADAAIRHAIDVGAPYRTEYRLLHPDGRILWIAAQGRAELDEHGRTGQLLGVCLDITDQRHAELEARELSGRLIHAQEDERRRIARELHDDLNQRLALLAVELDMLGTEHHHLEAAEIAEQVRTLSSDVHQLAYRLHPAKLDHIGLQAAARSWCKEVSEHSGVRVSFTSEGVPRELPSEVALCLFRLLQESLSNIVRHSGSTEARVALAGADGSLRLTVSDQGRGFDVASASIQGGLGLVSMRERVRLLRGTIDVESHRNIGSTITATLPI